MPKTSEKLNDKEGKAEHASRFLRNAHYLGAAALLGASVVLAPAAAVLQAGAAFEAVHGGAWDVARRHLKKKRQNKKS
jgi:hypothetical protein